jgi:hypothetical protein
LEQTGLIAIDNNEAFQYFSSQFPNIVLKVNEIISSTYSIESKKCALKCLEAWIAFSPTKLSTELLNTFIRTLYDLALLDETASCISKYLELNLLKPKDTSLSYFLKAVLNFLCQENIKQLISTNIGLAEIIKAISENYICILNKVIY